jgi:hypothetical protein
VRTTSRQLTEQERRVPLTAFLIFSFRRRRDSRSELARGEVEELEFGVSRAWNLISCSGPPCCPNTWLLRADTGEIVYVYSWTLLQAEHECFPGSQLTLTRLPLTHRLVSARVSGRPVRPDTLDAEDQYLVDNFRECEIVEPSRLPPGCRG